MIKSNPCKLCSSKYHTAAFCRSVKKAPVSGFDKNRDRLTKEQFSKIDKKKNNTVKARKEKISSLKKKLDKLVKDYIKKRDGYICQHCGKAVSGSDCHASHVIPVSRSGYLQFEPLNMKVMCYNCHMNWWHKHPVEAGKWFTDTFPERWEYLSELHIQRLKPLKEAQLIEKIEEYKAKLLTY